jgi:mRNA interferase MazF
VKRGEIRWYRFKAPDKRRPVVILTRDSVIEYLSEITVAPITSAIRDIPSEVALSKADGLPRECAVSCDHIQTVAKARIGRRIAQLSGTRLDELRGAVAFALGL